MGHGDPESIVDQERDELRTEQGFMRHREDVRYRSLGNEMSLVSDDGPEDDDEIDPRPIADER